MIGKIKETIFRTTLYLVKEKKSSFSLKINYDKLGIKWTRFCSHFIPV